ncbi:MAG: AAC(3) family N-acetyltransferase [Clostridia bacterium]|nr:AAC(3) family N-acetyltransferase [Clostridia bacterium]
MYTRDMLIAQLRDMGLQPTDTVMIHSSMKAIGPVEGGADTVLDALMAYFAPGLLLLPTHTWAQMNDSYSVYDPATEPACVGILPNLFMKRPGVVRSLHPTHSVAAYGEGAAAYIAGEENVLTPCAPEGCWGRLYTTGAKVLLIGVTHARNTFIHAVEEYLDVPERLADTPSYFTVVMPDGTHKQSIQYRHYNAKEPHVSEHFVKLTEGYYETGAAVRGQLGDAACILCDCRELYRVTERVLAHEINCFLDRDEIPRAWWQAG